MIVSKYGWKRVEIPFKKPKKGTRKYSIYFALKPIKDKYVNTKVELLGQKITNLFIAIWSGTKDKKRYHGIRVFTTDYYGCQHIDLEKYFSSAKKAKEFTQEFIEKHHHGILYGEKGYYKWG